MDISGFDEAANELRVKWRKMMNFASTFARDFRQHQEIFATADIAPDERGNAWTFSRWMLAKVGPSEMTALRVLEALEQTISSGDKERNRERLAEIKREKKAERARLKAEKQAAKEERDARRAAKLAAAPPPPPKPKAPLKRNRDHDAIYAFISETPAGRTCDEVESALGLRHQTASARVAELGRMGDIVKAGRRATRSGKTATVWVVAPSNGVDAQPLPFPQQETVQ